jgi:hypothetical protein
MNVLRQWDRLGIYLLLMAFGAYSTIYPIVSLKASAPYWASITLGSEFFLAGVLLILGMFTRPGFRMAGLLVVCIGLSTISLVIATYGGTRVLAYAFLFGAFAMQSVHDIRQDRRIRQARKDQENHLVEELNQLVEENGQGDKL